MKKRFDFKNQQGDELSGILELPDGPRKAFALFAHCFTCSKSLIAAAYISKELAQKGIAVLRFDFTGLGDSQGEFKQTNFKTNISDIISACQALSKEYTEPIFLIGHSLGGAAVLKTELSLENIKGVVTIGAPSDISHIKHLFKDKEDKIKKDGSSKVEISGRTFEITKQFIDDIENESFLSELNESKAAHLILHSPEDEVVSIEHADKIFGSLSYPKSLVSLDNMNHLLSNKDDARYVGRLIGDWFLRFFESNIEDKKSDFDEMIKAQTREERKFTMDIFSQHHQIIADEPKKLEGDDEGMNPYELLLSALGACTGMTLKMYAQRKNIKLKKVTVFLDHQKQHAKDCKECDKKEKKLDVIKKRIELEGELTSEQKERLIEIAQKCPVNKTLLEGVEISQL